MVEPFPTKILNLCAGCGRQYDVTHLEAGRAVRCECGKRFAVAVHEPHAPRALKCTHCGGNLAAGAQRCAYCSAEITLEELRLSCVCPACFARLASDARYCMECGVAIAPQALFALAEGSSCPRCKGELRQRVLGHTSIVECSHCAGMWLDAEAFIRLCERKEAEGIPEGSLARGPVPVGGVSGSAGAVQGYIPCLSCRQLMMRKNFASSSGVIIDVCRSHGVWLDAHELERVLTFIRGGGMDRARERQIERLREEERKARERRSQLEYDAAGPFMARRQIERTPFQSILESLLAGLF